MRALVDLEVVVHHQTKAACLVSLDGDRKIAVWVPFSLCELEMISAAKQTYTLTLPESVAIEKGLV